MQSWPQAVLFDLDGVIVDSEPVHLRAFQLAAKANDIDLTEAEYYRELIGYDDAGAWRRLFELRARPADDTTIRRIMDEKFAQMRRLLSNHEIEPLPGVRELIAALAPHCALAICSAAIRDEVMTILNGVGLAGFFRVVVCGDDVAVGKPDPAPYLLTLRRVAEMIGRSLRPEDCLVIEDAPAVVRSVRAVGFKTLGVATTRPIEDHSVADWAIHSLRREELCDAIAGLRRFFDGTET